MKIILVGGGSGGHITPLLAVADEIKKISKNSHLIHILSKGDKLSSTSTDRASIDKVVSIRAGKFRRYHGEGWRQWLDISTLIKNLRDLVFIFIGFIQAYKIIRKEKPAVIFIKGGYVGMPVGIAAALNRVPYITHDSDAIPGLANRLISRWAKLHTVAMPVAEYKYDSKKTIQVGVPIVSNYKFVSEEQKNIAKNKFDIKTNTKVILIIGGGLGASRLNDAIVKISPKLIKRHPETMLFHFVGPGNGDKILNKYQKVLKNNIDQVLVKEFVNDLYKYSAASDIIITRAGATTLAEFAAQGKACIVIPNDNLTGGHQSKNAIALAKVNAITIVKDKIMNENPEILLKVIEDLIIDKNRRKLLEININKTVINNSASKLAQVIYDAGSKNI